MLLVRHRRRGVRQGHSCWSGGIVASRIWRSQAPMRTRADADPCFTRPQWPDWWVPIKKRGRQ